MQFFEIFPVKFQLDRHTSQMELVRTCRPCDIFKRGSNLNNPEETKIPKVIPKM